MNRRRFLRSKTPDPPASPRTAAEIELQRARRRGWDHRPSVPRRDAFEDENGDVGLENGLDGLGVESGSSPEGSPTRGRSPSSRVPTALPVRPAPKRPSSVQGVYPSFSTSPVSNLIGQSDLNQNGSPLEVGLGQGIPFRRTLSLSALPPLMLASQPEDNEEEIVVIARSATPLFGLPAISEAGDAGDSVAFRTAAPLSSGNPNVAVARDTRISLDVDPRRLSISPPAPPDLSEIPSLSPSGGPTHHRHSYSFSCSAPRIITTSPLHNTQNHQSSPTTQQPELGTLLLSQKVVCTQCLHPLSSAADIDLDLEPGDQSPLHQPLLKRHQEHHGRTPRLGNAWEFAGWGHVYHLELPAPPTDSKPTEHHLSMPALVSIAANDLIGSIFYTIGVTVLVSGVYAPFSLLLVNLLVLLPYYFIFGELGTSVGLDGGVYSIQLVAGASKALSALAGAASLMCYVGTAVVAAASAVGYAGAEFGMDGSASPWIVVGAEIGVLVLFAGLVWAGAKESAGLATAIFGGHGVTTLVLLGAGLYFLIKTGGSVLLSNWSSQSAYLGPTSPGTAIFKGFVVGSLGITGLESTLNYVSKAGSRFPGMMKWLVGMVGLVNPVLAFLAISVVPLPLFVSKTSSILSEMGEIAAGKWLRYWVVADAVAVLGGTVLTAMVGVVGLLESIAADRILPSFMLQKNRWTKTQSWLILSFLLFTVGVTLVLRGNVQDLSIIFAFAFLSVLSFLALSALTMKYRRSKLRREIECPTWLAIGGFAAVLAAFLGMGMENVGIVGQFVLWVGGLWVVMVVVINWVPILKVRGVEAEPRRSGSH